MGEHNIQTGSDSVELREFTKKILADLRALEKMLDEGLLESGVTRIGAEQELFLVDPQYQPALKAMEILEHIEDERVTTELGRFNLEFNLDPHDLGGNCLSTMESDINELLAVVREAAAKEDCQIILTGILPTLDKAHLALSSMTPMPRYFALNEAMTSLRGTQYDFRIKGRDELLIQHDNVMLEACNTSFQVHFQVSPDNFARRYNLAQAVTAPVLAASTNSPLLFGKQLWRETRIALFQQSVDTRSPGVSFRERAPRVSFGRDWIKESALEIFQEDFARFRVIMSTETDDDPFDALEKGKPPSLKALRLHNGTVYRWNRPCYGISNGKPHLRIENRVLPSGPTPLDEVANAAFWFGLMSGVVEEYDDITKHLSFDEAHENFIKAARLGLSAQFVWPGHANVPAETLILEQLLPTARHGLQELDIDSADIDRYLGVIEDRVRSLRTPSQWMIDCFDQMREHRSRSERLATIVAGTIERQCSGEPAHTWKPVEPHEAGDPKKHYERVEQMMETDLFTVTENELVDMAAYVMNWRHIRHVPVEDNEHHLVGLITHRSLLRLLGEDLSHARGQAIPVSEIMQRNVITVTPDTPTAEAIQLMRRHKISCLPVVQEDNKLVGIITEHDFMKIAAHLLDRFLAGETTTSAE